MRDEMKGREYSPENWAIGVFKEFRVSLVCLKINF